MNKIFSLIIILFVFISTGAQIKPCSVEAWITDKDPKGLNVRKEPNTASEVVAKLLRGEDDIVVVISGSNGKGWMFADDAYGPTENGLLKKDGWVFAAMLGTGTKGSPNYNSPIKLYSKASKNSKVITSVPSEAEVKFVDCDGEWLKASYKGKTGWLAPENQCPSPWTTCS